MGATSATNELAPNEELFPQVTLPHGTSLLNDESEVLLHIPQKNENIRLQKQSEVVIGRTDVKSQTFPDLDLTPHGALEGGVSRNHAAIRRNDNTLTLIDLGSANGTFLNGKQIPPEHPHVLRDGDEISFGKLVSRIYFK